MKKTQAIRKFLGRGINLGIAMLFMATMFAPLLPVQTASAEVSDPVPPSDQCEWYGKLSNDTFTDITWSGEGGSTHQTQRDVTEFSSAPVGGETCGANWTATSKMDFLGLSPNGCGGTITATHNNSYAGSGTGILLGGLTMWGTEGLVAGFSGETQQTMSGAGNTFEGGYCFGGSNSSEYNDPKSVPATSSVCPEGATLPTGYFVNENAQAVAGTCVLDTTTTGPQGHVVHDVQTISWSFRRTVCDFDIDSDGGGVGDCQEYNDGTNPSDETDDGEKDSDDDGVFDSTDNCDAVKNADQANLDFDALGDACDPDDDNDTYPDTTDKFPRDPTEWADTDNDGVGDNGDPCPNDATNACNDTDEDNDGVDNDRDRCPGTPEGVPVDRFGCPKNRKPVAVKDEVTTPLNTPVSINVLANDSDPDGDAISLVSCTNPTNGQIEPFVSGYVTYTPNRRFWGKDTFRCTITDSRGAKASAAVVIKVDAGTVDLNLNIDYLTYWHNRTPSGRKGSDTVRMDGTSSAVLTATPDQLELVQSICVRPTWQVFLKQFVGGTVPADWSEGGVDLMGTPNSFWNQPLAISNVGSQLTSQAPHCSAPGQSQAVLSRPALEATENLYNFNLARIRHEFVATVTFIDGRTFTRTLGENESAATSTPLVKDLDEQSPTYTIRL